MDGERSGSSTRRRFLGTAAGATGVALASTVWGAKEAAAASLPEGAPNTRQAAARSFVPGLFRLDLGGKSAGWLWSVEGGHAVSDVVVEKLGPDHLAKKHIGNPKYEDFTLQFGFGVEKTFFDWISASFTPGATDTRRDGAIHVADFKRNERHIREFSQALITEIGFPAMDGSSKDPAYMTVKLTPEHTRFTAATGQAPAPPRPDRQKVWLPSNFRLEIDGLDCTRVNKIESLTIKQKVTENAVGQERDPQKEPGQIEYPNLVITLAESAAQTFFSWHDDFVIKGNSGDDKEKNGRLLLLSPDLKTTLLELELQHIGIFAVYDVVPPPDPEGNEDNGDAIRRVRFEMYFEKGIIVRRV